MAQVVDNPPRDEERRVTCCGRGHRVPRGVRCALGSNEPLVDALSLPPKWVSADWIIPCSPRDVCNTHDHGEIAHGSNARGTGFDGVKASWAVRSLLLLRL